MVYNYSMKTFSVKTKGFTDIIDITGQIEELLKKESVKSGVVTVFVQGSTAAVSAIEADPNLYEDMRKVLENIAPYKKDWKHHKTWGDDNGAAHIRATMFGPSETIPFENSKLLLGQWQRIVLMDFDTGPRTREVVVSW